MNLKESAENVTDEDSILNELLREVYFSVRVKQSNEDFCKSNFFDKQFYDEYKNLVANQMHRVIDSGKIKNFYRANDTHL